MSTKGHLSGTTLGQYELQELVQSGSVVKVYKRYQPSLKRAVFIQTLANHLVDDPIYRNALTKGAELIAEFEHPNIVPILDYGVENNIPYIVMRLMNGGSLQQRLDQGIFSLQEATAVIRQIASALDYVHSLGKIHGDPATVNIVFDAWGSAYLADFILAGLRSEMREGILGVPLYMAPERWREEQATPASDQYALGVIAYEMITGHPPFEAKHATALMYKHITAMPESPQRYRQEIPTTINSVLFRALAKNPEDRYPTVMDFARDFEQAIKTVPSHLFISYSRKNTDYTKALKQHLRSNGFQIWLDDEIEHGDQWFNQIHEAIKSCAAFLVIMSPDAEQSEWVQKEVLLAKRYKKPIFPLLLEGDEFALLIDLQFADIRDSSLPGTDFHRRVSRAVYGTS